MKFTHIVEAEPEPEKVDAGPEDYDITAVYPNPRKHLRLDAPPVRGAVCLSAIALLGAGFLEWVGVGSALAAVGAAILYAQGSRRR